MNDGVGNTRSWFLGMQGGNVANPVTFGGTHWIAPGGGQVVKNGPGPSTTINSSVVGSAYFGFSGTSFAAPHIAGAYAVGKGVNPAASVAAWTAWFQTNAAVDVPITTTSPAASFNIKRIRIP